MKRKIFIVVCVFLFLVTATPVQAVKFRVKRISVTADTASVLAAGTYVYGISILATSANAQMGIYDSATLPGASAPIDELGEATQYNRAESRWLDPIYFENGVTVIISNGVGFIDYASSS
jgi:hypothetical protein